MLESFFNKIPGVRAATSLKNETLAQVFSCEFCEIFKKNLFYRTPLMAASEQSRKVFFVLINCYFIIIDKHLCCQIIKEVVHTFRYKNNFWYHL